MTILCLYGKKLRACHIKTCLAGAGIMLRVCGGCLYDAAGADSICKNSAGEGRVRHTHHMHTTRAHTTYAKCTL